MLIFQSVTEKFDNFFDKDTFSSTNLFAKDAFDEFNNNSDVNIDKQEKTNGTITDKFDPFGLSVNDMRTSKNSSPAGNSFGFEANFANFDAFNNNPSNSDNCFEDAWGGFDTKPKKNKDSSVKANKVSKFSSDYSDKTYEMDLEQVLKRSMFDQ